MILLQLEGHTDSTKDKYIHIIQNPRYNYMVKKQKIEIGLVYIYNLPTLDTCSRRRTQIEILLQTDFETARKAHHLAQSHCLLVDVAKDGA